MRRPTRPIPVPGDPVAVVHLGVTEWATIEAVVDDGRTVIADGRRFTLRPVNARYVLDDEPHYGTRLAIGVPDAS